MFVQAIKLEYGYRRVCVSYLHFTHAPRCVCVLYAIKRGYGCVCVVHAIQRGYECVRVISLHSPPDSYLCVYVCMYMYVNTA